MFDTNTNTEAIGDSVEEALLQAAIIGAKALEVQDGSN